MKVEIISDIPSANGVISAGKILDMPEALVLKLAGKVRAISPPLNGGMDLPHWCSPSASWCSEKLTGACIRHDCGYYQTA